MRKQGARGTSNTNARGNTRDRAARRAYLMRAYASDVAGCVRCYRCGLLLTEATLTVDRIVPGKKGGKYVRSNIRPSCGPCANITSNHVRLDVKPDVLPARHAGHLWALSFFNLGREIQAARLTGRIAG